MGAAVNQLLRANADLTALVGDRIFSSFNSKRRDATFIIYQRTGLNPSYTKDRGQNDSVYLNIAIISESYGQSIGVASAVEKALEGKRGTFAGLNIADIKLADSQEGADEINFIQDLQFEIFIKNKFMAAIAGKDIMIFFKFDGTARALALASNHT